MKTHVLFEARTAGVTYLIFGAMFGPLCFLTIYEFHEWQSTIICSSVLVLTAAWLRSFRIRFDGESLSYQSLFIGAKSISVDQIASVRHEFGSDGPFSPPYRLVIALKDELPESSVVINTKMFSREDVIRLNQILAGYGATTGVRSSE